jgi:hypothetical protein
MKEIIIDIAGDLSVSSVEVRSFRRLSRLPSVNQCFALAKTARETMRRTG